MRFEVAWAFTGLLPATAAAAHTFRTSFTAPYVRQLLAQQDQLARRVVDPSQLYPEYNLSVPVDHFWNESRYEPHSDATFNLRYWFDASHYKVGGPVIILAAGETGGDDRLPYLQNGILAQLAQATHGIGVVLEHRYYGTSFPFNDLTTEHLRFLTTDQALADTAYFARNIVFPGLEHLNLTSAKNAYIAYGGSYAGAFVAILRKVYPDVFWGSISSSGVTEAIYDYWQYFEAQRIYGPPDCIEATQKLTNAIDNILIGKAGTDYVTRLKTVFGFGNLTRNDDFGNAINGGIYGLQSTNWDPAINSTSYGDYCDIVSSTALLYPDTVVDTAEVQELLSVGGYASELDKLTTQALNYIGYLNDTVLPGWRNSGATQDAYFTNIDYSLWSADDLGQWGWRSWAFQYCDQWGYLQTGSGAPADILPLISRTVDIPYTSFVCKAGFNITRPSDVDSINKHGGFGISYPRLAIIDGEHDPWRAATPHAIGQPDRVSTVDEPFHLIPKAVHHWDENGVFPNQTTSDFPPASIKEVQKDERTFVKKWMREWREYCRAVGGCLEPCK